MSNVLTGHQSANLGTKILSALGVTENGIIELNLKITMTDATLTLVRRINEDDGEKFIEAVKHLTAIDALPESSICGNHDD